MSAESMVLGSNYRLFPTVGLETRERERGVLPYQHIRSLVEQGSIAAELPIDDAQLQPASLDLRLGTQAVQVRASFLPGKDLTVMEAAEGLALDHLDLAGGAVLHAGSVYIIPLMEHLNLPDKLSAAANPKSSTGRVDVFARLITDRGERFDSIRRGYTGQLFLEVSPKTFSVRVQPGTRLNQIRFFRSWPEDQESSRMASSHSIVWNAGGEPAPAEVDRGMWFSVDLLGDGNLAGWRAKRNCPVVDLERVNFYNPREFWDPIPSASHLILGPTDFFILSSRERVQIPPTFAAEMAPYDEAMGEFRVHYAGFFDPGFGYGEGNLRGTRAVLEVRTHEVPYALKHGQRIGRLMYQPMLAEPGRLYGSTGSSYQDQGLGLSKHFRRG